MKRNTFAEIIIFMIESQGILEDRWVKFFLKSGMLILPVLILLGMRHLGYDGLYGQDSYEYLHYTFKVKEFFLGGMHPGDFFWPKGFSLVTAFFAFVFSISLAGQMVSLLSLYGILYFSYKSIKELYDKSNFSIVFLCIALLSSPYMLRSGLISMSDMLASCSLSGSVYFGLRYYKIHSLKVLLPAVFFGMLSFFTRYVAAVPVFFIFLSLVYVWAKNIRWTHLLALLIPFGFGLVHFYFETNDAGFFKHQFLMNWDFGFFISNRFTTVNGTREYIFPNIVHVFGPFFHPGFFFLNSILVVFIVWEKVLKINFSILVIALAVLCYALFLAGIPNQNNRFLLHTYPLVLVLLFPAFEFLMQKVVRFRNLIIVGLFAIQLALFARAIEPTYKLNVLEKSISQQMQDYQNQTLYSFDIDVALQGRGLEFEYVNMWKEEYSSFESGALVLFNIDKFKTQWEGKNPIINWNNLNMNYQLKPIEEFESGWKLYRIEE